VVTGNKNIVPAFKQSSQLESNGYKGSHAVIEIRVDGCSILITGSNKREILAIGVNDWKSTSNRSLVVNIENWLTTMPFALKDFQSVHWVLSLPKFSLIPESLFVAEKAGVYLTQTCHLLEDDMIYMDHWKKSSLNCVYAIPSALDDWLSSNFPGSTFSHSSQSMFNCIPYLTSKTEQAFINIHIGTAELLLCKHGEVVLYNQFAFTTAEDLAYYLLFALENSNMLATETLLYLSGNLTAKKTKLAAVLDKYIGTVKEVEKPLGFELSKPLTLSDFQQVFSLCGEL